MQKRPPRFSILVYGNPRKGRKRSAWDKAGNGNHKTEQQEEDISVNKATGNDLRKLDWILCAFIPSVSF